MFEQNYFTCFGHLTKDPETKEINSTAKCTFTIALNRKYKDKYGTPVIDTYYFDVETWRELAQACAVYLKKGMLVHIEAYLKQERWEKDGKTFSRFLIVANRVQFPPKNSTAEPTKEATPDSLNIESLDELPF